MGEGFGIGVLVAALLGVALLASCDLGERNGRYQCANHPTDSACVALRK